MEPCPTAADLEALLDESGFSLSSMAKHMNRSPAALSLQLNKRKFSRKYAQTFVKSVVNAAEERAKRVKTKAAKIFPDEEW